MDSHIYQAVKQNAKVIARSDDWLTLAYMEPLYAKELNAIINHGERESHEIVEPVLIFDVTDVKYRLSIKWFQRTVKCFGINKCNC